MAGIENILEQIALDSTEQCDCIISQAQKKCEEIAEAAKNKCEEIKNEAIKKDSEAEKLILSLACSKAHSNGKKKLLEVKQAKIDEVVSSAQNYLYNLEKTQYFDVLLSLVNKYATGEKGYLCLNNNDKDNITADFTEKIKQKNLEISKDTAKIKAGFILQYGGIEENCAFEAILHANRELISDEIGKILF